MLSLAQAGSSKYCYRFGFLILTSSMAFGQWVAVKSTGTNAGLRGVHNAGKGVVWASGTGGTVLRSDNNGLTWGKCPMPAGTGTLDFRAIWGWDGSHAVAMSIGTGDASRLYETTDACSSWHLLFRNPDPSGFWDGLTFSGTNGILVGDPVRGRFTVFRTTDGGLHWTRDSSPELEADGGRNGIFAASNSSVAMRFPGEGFAFATGGLNGARFFAYSPRMSGTGNPKGQTSWTSESLPLAGASDSAGAFSLAFRSPSVGVAVGGDYKQPGQRNGTAAYTNDGGAHWTASSVLPSGFRSAVAWEPELRCWISAGTNGSDVSFDDGKTWLRFSAGNWNALSLPWVVGPDGQIARLDEASIKALGRGK